jgi:VWFA-related protein
MDHGGVRSRKKAAWAGLLTLSMFFFLITILAVSFSVTAVWGQQPAAPAAGAGSQEQLVIRTGAIEVMVDVVVKDKRGRLIRDLKPEDFVVQEDGVAQAVTSWRETIGVSQAAEAPDVRIQRQREAPAAGVAATRATVEVPRQVRLISLVFERLGVESRRRVRQAALELIRQDLGDNVYYAVLYVDRSLHVVQTYTNNAQLLERAIERVTNITESRPLHQDGPLERMAGAPAPSAPPVAQQAGGAPALNTTALSDAEASAMAGNMREYSRMLEDEDFSRISVFSLWAVIRELDRFPGRKSVLYFSEGLILPNQMAQQYRAMVSSANRANVTIYAIDARGVEAISDQAAAIHALTAATTRSASAQTENRATAGDFRTVDIALNATTANLQQNLLGLAESTGGVLIAANDLRPHLRRLSQEFNTYYELTYRSSNPNFDGKFRAITVKVNRPDAVVQARNGYFALPPMEGQFVFPYEVELLHALGRTPLPHDLEVLSSVIPFQSQDGFQQASLVVDFPLHQVHFTYDEKSKSYFTNISVVSLVKDPTGHVVAKLSRNVPLSQPEKEVERFRQGRFIVSRKLQLPPGRYLVESAAMDHLGGKIGAMRSVFVAQRGPEKGPQMSALSLLRRVDPQPAHVDEGDPLYLGQERIVPTLIDQVPLGSEVVLSVFFRLYPDAKLAEKPKLYLDLLHDGKLIARAEPDLPPADAHGGVPYLANTSVGKLPAGRYEFRATLMQGELGAQRTIAVNLE